MPFGRAGELSVARAVGSDAGGVFGGKKTMRFRHQNGDAIFWKPDIKLKKKHMVFGIFVRFRGVLAVGESIASSRWQAAGHAHAKHLKMQDGRCPRHRNITGNVSKKRSHVSQFFFLEATYGNVREKCVSAPVSLFFFSPDGPSVTSKCHDDLPSET